MKMAKSDSSALLSIHICLAILWIYQGLIPKILFKAPDELRIWQLQGINEMPALALMQFSGCIEIIFGTLFLIFRRNRLLHLLNITGMLGLSLLIVIIDIGYFRQAFNPFVMNLAMAALSVVALQLITAKPSAHVKKPTTHSRY